MPSVAAVARKTRSAVRETQLRQDAATVGNIHRLTGATWHPTLPDLM